MQKKNNKCDLCSGFCFYKYKSNRKKNDAICTRYFDFTNTDKTKKVFLSFVLGILFLQEEIQQ